MTEPLQTEPLPPQRPGIRWGRVAIVLFILLVLPASWIARRVASRMEYFHVRSVSVEGIRYLKLETVMDKLKIDTLRSVWDDTDDLARRLNALNQVSEVEIDRKLPGTLVVRIKEDLPVALAPTAHGLEAIDSAGMVLPIDPAEQQVDLPIANQRDKTILAILTSLRGGNPMLFRRVDEISRGGPGEVVMTVSPLDVTPGISNLRVRVPVGVSPARLADLFPVESDLARRRANVAELDLRYRDQVIARLQ